MTFIVTPAHKAFFDYLADGDGNAILEAVAGSGKTATCLQAMSRILDADEAAEVLYVAFNKRVITDIGPQLDPRATAATMHSVGMRSLRRGMGRKKPRVKAGKVNFAIKALRLPRELHRILRPVIAKLVAGAKAVGLAPETCDFAVGLVDDTPEAWNDIIERFNIEAPGGEAAYMDQAIALARRVLDAGLRDLSLIDFDDMLYAPVVLGHGFPKYDWVFVDEAQDFNPIQRAIIPRLLDGRLVAVGDTRQAIYGFRGADHDSMEQIKSDFSCEVFPLSTSYRVAKAIEERVQDIVPHFSCHENNATGSVNTMDVVRFNSFGPTDLVLCRNNAPLVGAAFALIRNDIPCQVLGKDLEKGLLALVDNLKANNLQDLNEKLSVYMDRETQRLRALNRDAAAAAVLDKVEVLRLFMERADDLYGLSEDIEGFFAPDNARGGKVTLSTVHKAKGGEADVVWILDDHLMPSKMAKTDAAKLQEQNLRYVAYTRAKKELNFVLSENLLS